MCKYTLVYLTDGGKEYRDTRPSYQYAMTNNFPKTHSVDLQLLWPGVQPFEAHMDFRQFIGIYPDSPGALDEPLQDLGA